MNYFILRDGQHYGPYTLADLQRYVASGEVLLSDMATSEGMAAPVPVGQIIGNIAAPVAYPAGYQTGAPVAMATFYPDPPNLHWGLLLLLQVVTCGIFSIVWDLVQASWMKKVDSESKALFIYIGACVILVGVFFASFFSAMNHSDGSAFTGILQIASSIVIIVARFNLRASLEKHFNQVEPMGLVLSGVMTFFFGNLYFQYHFNDINRRKMMDRMYAANR